MSLKCCKITRRLLSRINRKSYTRIRLVPKSTTLDDLKGMCHPIARNTHSRLELSVLGPWPWPFRLTRRHQSRNLIVCTFICLLRYSAQLSRSILWKTSIWGSRATWPSNPIRSGHENCTSLIESIQLYGVLATFTLTSGIYGEGTADCIVAYGGFAPDLTGVSLLYSTGRRKSAHFKCPTYFQFQNVSTRMAVLLYTVCQKVSRKRVSIPLNWPIFNLSAGTFCGKFVIKWLLNIGAYHHSLTASLHYLVKYYNYQKSVFHSCK